MTWYANPSGGTMLGAGPEYYNNLEAPDNCVGGSESQCARPFLFAQQNWPHTCNLINILATAAFPGLGRPPLGSPSGCNDAPRPPYSSKSRLTLLLVRRPPRLRGVDPHAHDVGL